MEHPYMRSYNYLLFFVAHDLHRSRRFPSHFTCLSDNMFGLIAGSDIQRIPSAGTPLTMLTPSSSFAVIGHRTLELLPSDWLNLELLALPRPVRLI